MYPKLSSLYIIQLNDFGLVLNVYQKCPIRFKHGGRKKKGSTEDWQGLRKQKPVEDKGKCDASKPSELKTANQKGQELMERDWGGE